VTSSIELAIFDIAGTFIEDHSEVADALPEALGANDIEVAEEQSKEWQFQAAEDRALVERQFGRRRDLPLIERTYRDFRILLEQRCMSGVIAKIDGAEDIFQRPRSRDIKLATTTGFYRHMRDRILRELRWEYVFDANGS
jgi:beta-phosphoglucomutase-like phosphatase (HAD superfamily)